MELISSKKILHKRIWNFESDLDPVLDPSGGSVDPFFGSVATSAQRGEGEKRGECKF